MKRHVSRFTFYVLRFTFLAILLLAAFLRFYRLDAQSFWNDEGNSARIAERSLDLIVEGAAGDIHPPGYYLLLHYWRALFGQSEFALRSLSVVAGLALVAFTYLTGRRLFGQATGLIAAFLGAISPFAIYYSQEARMYALLAALSTASFFVTCVLCNTDNKPSSRFTFHVSRLTLHAPRILHLACYVLVSAAGLYTHYAFAFVLFAHNAVFGLWWLVEALRSRPDWRRLATWAGAQVAVVALYAPWLPIALGAAGWSSPTAGYALGPALLDVLRVLTVGTTLPLDEAGASLVVAGSLLLVGLWPGRRPVEGPSEPERRCWLPLVSVALAILIPLALFFAFELYKPAWLKFLVIILAPFHIIVARGVSNLASIALYVLRNTQHATRFTFYVSLGLLLLALATLTYPSLHNLYSNPAYARDDYRQLAADVEAIHRPGDAIVLNAPNQWEVFTYYYPDRDVYPAPYHPSRGGVARFLEPLLGRYDRLFVLYWGDAESDPHRRIEGWLATHAYKAGDRWYGDVRLATYGVAPLPEEPAVTLDARFGGSVGGSTAEDEAVIGLRGYALEDKTFVRGDVVPVTLFWKARASIDEPYKVTVQLLDDGGQIVAQVDTVPQDGLAPTTAWQSGESLIDRYGVYLPPDAPPGRYPLLVALYHAFSGERLAVTLDSEAVGDHLVLGEILIRAR